MEAHPDVQQHMRKLGWDAKPGVQLIFSRWQDAMPLLPANSFDGVFWDTYMEAWAELREFHRLLPRILRPGGRYTYFNGAAPQSSFLQQLHHRMAALELSDLGFDVVFTPTEIH